ARPKIAYPHGNGFRLSRTRGGFHPRARARKVGAPCGACGYHRARLARRFTPAIRAAFLDVAAGREGAGARWRAAAPAAIGTPRSRSRLRHRAGRRPSAREALAIPRSRWEQGRIEARSSCGTRLSTRVAAASPGTPRDTV